MDKRELRQKLRQSNVDDLLDDGVENGSDLKIRSQVDDDDEGGQVPDAAVPIATDGRNARQLVRRTATLASNASDRTPVSRFGVALGVGFVIAGILVFKSARDLNVLHDSIRRRFTWIEHVTATESRVYAVIAIALGVGLCVYSLYRPRR